MGSQTEVLYLLLLLATFCYGEYHCERFVTEGKERK